jgi:hypothetical protein
MFLLTVWRVQDSILTQCSFKASLVDEIWRGDAATSLKIFRPVFHFHEVALIRIGTRNTVFTTKRPDTSCTDILNLQVEKSIRKWNRSTTTHSHVFFLHFSSYPFNLLCHFVALTLLSLSVDTTRLSSSLLHDIFKLMFCHSSLVMLFSKKGKRSLCSIKHHAIKTYGGVKD